jgi:hypothetical protein
MAKEKHYFRRTDAMQDRKSRTDLAKIRGPENNQSHLGDAITRVESRVICARLPSNSALRMSWKELPALWAIRCACQRPVESMRAATDNYGGETYERGLADVFASKVRSQRRLPTTPSDQAFAKEKAAIERPPTGDITAFDLYTRGKIFFLRRPSAVAQANLVAGC